MEESSIISGKVDTVAFGGEGIVRHDGFVVFVPFTAPGDHITCRITQKKKRYARAELISIEKQAPERIKARCPYFGVCGGCQLQHLTYDAQLQLKRKWVEDALRITIDPVVPATQQWTYRRHITLTLRPQQGSFQAGYIGIDNQSVVSVSQCPIFCEESDPILMEIQRIAKALKATPDNQGRVSLLKHHLGGYLAHFQFEKLPPNCREVLSESQLKGVVVSVGNKSFSLGEMTTSLTIDGMQFFFSPQTFIQNHPEQSLNIYRTVVEKASGSKKILDLYCGIGISSLLLAKQGVSVVSVESNPIAIALAKENAILNGLEAEFLEADVQTILPRLLKEKPDLVIVNPPRTGLDPKVVQTLIHNPPNEIIYISCMPPTLARDLKPLSEFYQIKECQTFDMFPQTAHIETFLHLKKI